jgi:putative lipoprotein
MRPWWIAASLLLAACGFESGDSGPEAVEEPVTLSGEAFYLERIVMPPGSWLELELFDEDGERSLLVERLDEIGAPPYPFELRLDDEHLHETGQITLYLTLYLPDGSPRFAAEAVADLFERALEPIRLVAVDFSEQDPVDLEESAWISYQCGDIGADIRYLDEDDILLSLPWRDVTLQPVEAASGARARGEGHEFWSRGRDQARLILPDESETDCTRTLSPSPWTEARDRGVEFRGMGQEPGWLIEVSPDESPALRLLLDNGTRELTFDQVEFLPDRSGFKAEAPGNQVEVELVHAHCQDSMVDWIFPVQVSLSLNELNLSACGRFFQAE